MSSCMLMFTTIIEIEIAALHGRLSALGSQGVLNWLCLSADFQVSALTTHQRAQDPLISRSQPRDPVGDTHEVLGLGLTIDHIISMYQSHNKPTRYIIQLGNNPPWKRHNFTMIPEPLACVIQSESSDTSFLSEVNTGCV